MARPGDAPAPFENVDGAGKRGWNRRHEDRVTPVLELLDDECRDKAFVAFEQRWLPDVLDGWPRHLLGEAPDQRVARNSLEKSFFEPSPGPPARPGCGPRHRPGNRSGARGGWTATSRRVSVRQQQRDWPHEAHDRLHSLEQQQDGEVDRNDDEQAGEHRSRGERQRLFHGSFPSRHPHDERRLPEPSGRQSLSKRDL